MPTNHPGETRTSRRHARSFENLVRSGLSVIAQRGLYETTVEHITEAADLGKGTFYAHFTSKDDLVHHLVQHGFDELMSAGRVQATEAAGTPAERLAALLQAQFQVLGRRRDLVILLHQVRGLLIIEPEARQALRQEYERYLEFLAHECRAALGVPRMSAGQARGLACAIAGFVAGTLSFELLLGRARIRESDLASPIAAFAAGVAAQYNGHTRPASAPHARRAPALARR